MRRSVRDAIVGFTVVGGVVAFAATSMWLRGVRLGGNVWNLSASFRDAGGLAERSPVTYRGIVVGSVRAVRVTAEAVVADLEINKADLQLARPVTAMVAASLEQIEVTTKEFEALTVQLQDELAKAAPVIRNLEVATAHLNNIAASLDNPQTLSDLKQTAANAAQLTATIDAVGGDVAQLTSDPEFMKGVRNLTIGLGELFGEIFPAQTAQ